MTPVFSGRDGSGMTEAIFGGWRKKTGLENNTEANTHPGLLWESLVFMVSLDHGEC